MKKIFILFTLMCALWKAEGQSSVTQAEYFLDTDPGRGKATPIAIPTPSTNIKNVPFTVSMTSLSDGFHRVYMRTYDGRWSHTNSTIIYKLPSSSSLSKIVGAEYFIDTDPGQGKGKAISITANFDVSDASFTLPLTTVTEGFHRLYLRTRNGSGTWGHTSSYMFFKMVVGVSDTTIAQAEYFVDSDPGHGKATAIAITPAKNIANASFSLPLSTLTEGFHRLYIRTRDGFKRWSLTNTQLFYKYVIPQTDTTITQVEYFVDTDPGFGKATQVSITPAKNLVNKEFTLPISSVSTGIHRLFIRSKNGYNKWSHANSVLFYKYDPPADTALTQVEYFIDTDPGFGKGIQVVMNPAAKWRDSTFQMNITGLTKGTHTFYLRTRSNTGKWSLTNTDTFRIGTVPAAPAIVVSKFTKRGMCSGESFSLSYHRTGSFVTGNVFQAQISDKNGSFASPTVLGALTSNTSGIISCQLPSHFPTGFRYRMRIVSTNPVVTGVVSLDSLYINDRPNAPKITGDSNVNVNVPNIYSVPLEGGSSWKWTADSGSVSAVKNIATINWSKIGTARRVRVTETSKFGCEGDMGTTLVNVFALSIDSVRISNSVLCPGRPTSVTAIINGAFKPNNTFTAQLSNNLGSFAVPVNIGSLVDSFVGVGKAITIPVTLPFPMQNGTAYKVRIVSGNPVATSSVSINSLTITRPNIGSDRKISKCPGSVTNLTTLFVTTDLTVIWNTPRPDSVVNPGSYRIIVTNTRGCRDTAFVTVSDFAKPIIGNDTTLSVCPGGTRSIRNVYKLSTFPVQQWSTANPDTVGAGVYTLIGTNANGCSDTVVINIVSTCPVPVALSTSGVTSSKATVSWRKPACFGVFKMQYRAKNTVPFTASTGVDSFVNIANLLPGTVYEWQVQTVCSTSPLDTSGYSALVEFTTPTSLAKSVSAPIAKSVATEKWKASVYPNPAKNKAVLQVNGISNYAVSISTTEGKVLWQTNTVNRSALELPVAGFSSGVYLVTIKHKTSTKSIQLIVEH